VQQVIRNQLVDVRNQEEAYQDFKPFLNEIFMEPIPPNYVVPKISMFLGRQDSNAHVQTF